jgi:rubrerythrin
MEGDKQMTSPNQEGQSAQAPENSQKPQKPQKTQKTHDNLEAAFAGESMANRKYLYFARLARMKGDEEVARLFEATADEETAHAFGHLSQLYPPEELEVSDLLRIAMEGELYETNQMYPEFARIAQAEQQAAALREFEEQAAESKGHAQLFEEALKKAEKRFLGLAKVEKRHAQRYADALQKIEKREPGHRAAE